MPDPETYFVNLDDAIMSSSTGSTTRIIEIIVSEGKRRVIFACDGCGKPKTTTIGQFRLSTYHYCNEECLHASYTGDKCGSYKHGYSKLPEYGIWQAMKNRCYRTKGQDYENYGGRGIKVCERWRSSVVNFIEDMGLRPSKSHSINRKDNDANYSCGKCDECLANGWTANCEWATRNEQLGNRRNSVVVGGPTGPVPLSEACRQLGISFEAVRNYIYRSKQSPDEALRHFL